MNKLNKTIHKAIVINSSIIRNNNLRRCFTTSLFTSNKNNIYITTPKLYKTFLNNNNDNNININKKHFTTSKDNNNDKYSNMLKEAAKFIFNFKLNDALKIINEMIEMEPNNPVGYQTRGEVYVIQKKGDLAINDFEKILELTQPPSDTTTEDNNDHRDRAYHFLAMIQREKGNLDKAIEYTDKAFSEDCISLDNLILKAELLQTKKEYLAAAHIYGLALSEVDRENNNDISAQFLCYRLAENIVVCLKPVLEENFPNGGELSTYLEEIPSNQIEFLKTYDNSFNFLTEKCGKLRDYIGQIIKNTNLPRNSKDRQHLDLLKSIFTAMTTCSVEAMNVMNNPMYQKPNKLNPSIKLSDFIFEFYKEIISKYFK
ncbi:hypothetical protein DICPUDRAFT_155791 [Dictyostelium purpureum]|uniref:Uncharacterized protein n=1 Tax=Dictyostelium purpureum TaxID=5786 RepID=F0ZUW5_DICPU|nr:uncharacterized protein DICPUDRAFT_155791 [Dictyostelium purpureum]EGC32274.1 hypothetical protein DICPUDRAFT_155791 [Dictyostelium purpureum]|eukprot:XP_003291211.1 hypothetical protein DICPUDRAFT_155791 [Dictyostelium purpureum]